MQLTIICERAIDLDYRCRSYGELMSRWAKSSQDAARRVCVETSTRSARPRAAAAGAWPSGSSAASSRRIWLADRNLICRVQCRPAPRCLPLLEVTSQIAKKPALPGRSSSARRSVPARASAACHRQHAPRVSQHMVPVAAPLTAARLAALPPSGQRRSMRRPRPRQLRLSAPKRRFQERRQHPPSSPRLRLVRPSRPRSPCSCFVSLCVDPTTSVNSPTA